MYLRALPTFGAIHVLYHNDVSGRALFHDYHSVGQIAKDPGFSEAFSLCSIVLTIGMMKA